MKINKRNKIKRNFQESEKIQIVLTDTSRNFQDYLTSLNTRFNGNYLRLPHYIIEKGGMIHQILEDNEVSAFFANNKINNKVIVISLENYGWVRKNPLSNEYSNWIGDSVSTVKERKWRNHHFWDIYTEKQVKSLTEVLRYLFNKHKIDPNFVGHNVKIDGVEQFKGVTSLSNYEKKSTKLNPSFDFIKMKKQFENESI
jgi:N-acetyl-anhydromuramyl-L-alanine amidase AmpD